LLFQKVLEDFKKIWREQFGEDISDEKAAEEGIDTRRYSFIKRELKAAAHG